MNPTPFLLFLLLLGTFTISSVAALGFNCSSTTTKKCQALVGYAPKNASTLSDIATLFGLQSHSSLLGPNALPFNTSKHHKVNASQTIRIPISCSCANGSGYSDHSPVYVVKPGDFLDHIARDVFSELLVYASIATVNKIANPSLIQTGQKLWIPLPCSCDQVEKDFPIEHYAHVVAKGTDLAGIAAQFGTTQTKLMTLNGISDPTTLQEGQVLDVPLQVCSSDIQNTSLDSSLAVADGSYAFTARNCVLCRCSSASWRLDCVPNTLGHLSHCHSLNCSVGGMTIGNRSIVGPCQENVCSYLGYQDNNTILTGMITQSTCPASPAPSPNPIVGAAASTPAASAAMGWLLMLGLLASAVSLG